MSEWVDPVHKCSDKWCFWDEVWAFEHGPYDTEEFCRAELNRYMNEMEEE